MTEMLIALALAPWRQPLVFRPGPGWQSGSSGTVSFVDSGQGPRLRVPKESAAWTARDVRYRSRATDDPPNATLRHLRPTSVIVWALVEHTFPRGPVIRLDLRRAKRYACCEGEGVPGGEFELTGAGPCRAYSVIVRVYFGSRPTRALRAQAQHALGRLELPPPRRC